MERRQLLGIARRAEHEARRPRARAARKAIRISGAIVESRALGYAGDGGGRMATLRSSAALRRLNPTVIPFSTGSCRCYEIVERHRVARPGARGRDAGGAREQDLQRSAIVRAIFRAREIGVGAEHQAIGRPHRSWRSS